MAITTAACDTEVVERAMAVSVRARLPVSSAWRNSRFRPARGRAVEPGRLPRVAHLAEDLVLTDDDRVETGRDLEEVSDRRRVVLAER